MCCDGGRLLDILAREKLAGGERGLSKESYQSICLRIVDKVIRKVILESIVVFTQLSMLVGDFVVCRMSSMPFGFRTVFRGGYQGSYLNSICETWFLLYPFYELCLVVHIEYLTHKVDSVA